MKGEQEMASDREVEKKEKPKNTVLEVQSVRHVLNVNTNPQQKEKKKNG